MGSGAKQIRVPEAYSAADDEDADLNDPFEMKTQPGGLAMGKSPVFYKDTPASMLPETRSPTRQSQFSFAVDDDD